MYSKDAFPKILYDNDEVHYSPPHGGTNMLDKILRE
jgi:hypothetical protein